jgi:hypothetical protein
MPTWMPKKNWVEKASRKNWVEKSTWKIGLNKKSG